MRPPGLLVRTEVMNHQQAQRRRVFGRAAAVSLLLSVLAACGGSTERIDFTGRVVEPPFAVRAAELQDTSGEAVSLGKDGDARQLRLVFFGYTHCPDICPTVLASLASGLTKLTAADRRRVQTFFVTTDPSRDTSEALSTYLSRFDESFEGLSGDIDTTAKIARSVGIYVDQGEELPSGGYDPNSHSTYIVAIDKQGKAPAFWNPDTSPSQFAADITHLLHGDVR